MKTKVVEYENLGKLNQIFFDEYLKKFSKGDDIRLVYLGQRGRAI